MKEESLNIVGDEKGEIPLSPNKRMKEIMGLPSKDKINFLPGSGFKFTMGPFVYEVSFLNVGQLRFSAKLVDVIIEGVNDGS